jgi:hypothetical protein
MPDAHFRCGTVSGSITVNGKTVGRGRIEKTMGAVYSLAAETADIGRDSETTDYDAWNNNLTGTVEKVRVKHGAV